MDAALDAVLRVLPALALLLTNGVILIWMLRKVLGHLHLRLGPTKNGPFGLTQTLFDVVKLVTKEAIAPKNVDKLLYYLAPLIVFVPALLMYAPLPFSETLVMADMEYGLIFLFVMSAIGPLGVFLAGWASANKWSLLGAVRSIGQQVFYEIPLLLSVIPIVMITGSLNLVDISLAQSGMWNIVWQFPAFIIFFIAVLSELNQPPFDLAEAETELIGGFGTEYSAMKFGLMYLAEFSNTFIAGALITTLFFGGFTLGPFSGPVVFILKTYFWIFVIMIVRGTMPRLRVDQQQLLNWKFLLPASLAWIMTSAVILKVVA